MASTSIDLYVDEAYLELLAEDDTDHPQLDREAFEVVDDMYAHGMQLQEVLVSSAAAATKTLTLSILPNLSPAPPKPLTVLLRGQPSRIICEICDDPKDRTQMLDIGACSHSYCADCVGLHVAAKVWDGAAAVSCPAERCSTVIELEAVSGRLPRAVADRWAEVKCEALFVGAEKLYCPFKDCSAVLLREEEGRDGGLRECECPECHRLFCARCGVPWHAGVECEALEGLEVEERGREDLMVRDMAKTNNWGRCPQCKFYVERTQGCLHMTCRCKYEFCYGCGSQWSAHHDAGCQRN